MSSLIRQAAAGCDRLVLALNTDASVRRLKGPTRPLQSETARAEVVGALKGVACVVLFDEDTPLELITALQPDLLVKGADYTEETVVGAEVVKAGGGRVMLARLVPEQSTSRLVARGARRRRMILVTGGAGFIGSNICADLEAAGRRDIVVADSLGHEGKWRNIAKRNLRDVIFPAEIEAWLAGRAQARRRDPHGRRQFDDGDGWRPYRPQQLPPVDAAVGLVRRDRDAASSTPRRRRPTATARRASTTRLRPRPWPDCSL